MALQDLTPDVPLGLHLTDSTGSSIPNARVNLRKNNNSYITNTKTDTSGMAIFQTLPNAIHILEVDYNGAKYATDPITVTADTVEQMELPVTPDTAVEVGTNALSLLLADSNGDPLADVRVNLRKSNGSYVMNVKTNADGIAAFETVPEAVHILEVDYNGGKYQTEPLTVAGLDGEPVAIQTLPLRLEFSDSEGNSIPDARVNLRKENGSYITNTKTGGTDQDTGIASFEVLPNATHILEVDYNGGKYSAAPITVTPETVQSAVKVGTLPLTVALTNDTAPLVNQRVDLLKDTGSYVTNLKTDADGSVIFEVLPGALHKVRSTLGGTTWVSDPVNGGEEAVIWGFGE